MGDIHKLQRTRSSGEQRRYVALLRAINVGGTGKLPMAQLTKMCTRLGFAEVQTYIASGNVVFSSSLSAKQVRLALEKTLFEYFERPADVIVRTAEEMQCVVERCPFSSKPANQVIVYFWNRVLDENETRDVAHHVDEQLSLGSAAKHGRELYVYYPRGLGSSKLKIRASNDGTGRNMNTVGKLASLAAGTACRR